MNGSNQKMQGFIFSSEHLCYEQDFFLKCLINLKWITVFFIAQDGHDKPGLHGFHHKKHSYIYWHFMNWSKDVFISHFMSTFTTYTIQTTDNPAFTKEN